MRIKNRSRIVTPIFFTFWLVSCTSYGTVINSDQYPTVEVGCPRPDSATTTAAADANYQMTHNRSDIAAADETKIIESTQSPNCYKFIAYLNRGEDYRRLKKYDLATADANSAIKTHFNDPLAYILLAFIEADQHEMDSALKSVTQAITANPTLVPPYLARSAFYANLAQYQKAIDDDTVAISLSPHTIDAYFHRARMFAAIHDYDDEIADETIVISLNPKANNAYILRSLAYHAKGQSTQAEADRNAALALYPKNSGSWNNTCWFLAHVDDLPEALISCQQALAISPDDQYSLDSTGFVYLKLKNYRQSIIFYDKALQVRPNEAVSLYGLGLAEQGEGNSTAAEQDMTAAERINPIVSKLVLETGY